MFFLISLPQVLYMMPQVLYMVPQVRKTMRYLQQ